MNRNACEEPCPYTAAWLSQQVIEAFPWDTAPSFLLRDRDASYGSVFSKRVAAMENH